MSREGRQREEVAELDRALEVFDDPETATRPGMQLMRDAVRGKRDKLAAKLEEEQLVRLEVVVGGVPATGGTVDPALLAELLAAVPDLATDAAAALLDEADPRPSATALDAATELGVAGAADSGLGVRLVGPPADVRAAVPAAGGGPLLDAALARVVDDVAGGRAERLTRLAAEWGAIVHLVLHLPFEDPREATVGGGA